MIDKLWQDTAAATGELQLDALFDNRSLRRVVGGGVLLSAALLVGTVLAPASARTFALRHLGMQIDYPRDTTLVIELPPAGPDLQREDRDGVTELVLPAGADLHVSVHAQGIVPKEAVLDLRTLRDDGSQGTSRELPLTPRPNDRFRHVFRRLSGAFQFRARGGDDDYGDRLVIVRTVRPAQVATLAATIEPPAYTGVERIEQAGGAIEALIGSQVDLTVKATAPVREATLVFLESGRRIELLPTEVQDDGGESLAFRCAFALEESDRYQIELLAENGLRNPNPGTYPISALQDYAPVGRWLLPEDDGITLLPTGLLCLRVEARDDFGLVAVDLSIENGETAVLTRQLLGAPTEGQPPARSTLPTEIVEIAPLLGGDGQSANDGLFVLLNLRDNKAPTAGEAELPRRIVQIVDPPQLAARIAKAFRRLREEVTQAADIQADRRGRIVDLAARMADPENPVSAGETAQILTGVEVGQGRIAGAVARVHRGLMRSFDLHLWNRLEPSQHAATVVELYREHSRNLTEPIALDPAFYRDLSGRRAAGTLGAMENTLDPILAMIDMTDQLARGAVPEVARLLAEAQVARDAGEARPLLEQVQVRQQGIEETLAQLLLRLEEWNDYQDLVQEVRALRDSQSDLQSRTEEEAKGK